MAKIMNVFLAEGSSTMIGPHQHLDYIRSVLSSAVEVDRSAERTVFHDLWRDTTITVSREGRQVRDILVKGESYIKGERVEIDAMHFLFPEKSVSYKKLVKGFEDFMAGETGTPFSPLKKFSQSIRVEESTRSGETSDYYIFEGTELDDAYYLSNARNRVFFSTGDDKIYGGDQFDFYWLQPFSRSTVAPVVTSSKVKDDGVILRTNTGDRQFLSDVEQIWLDDGDDNLRHGIENGNTYIIDSGGNNLLGGRQGDDIITARDGDNKIWGRAGNDLLISNAGSDTLWGGQGDDILASAANQARTGDMDKMIGGSGSDLFVLGSPSSFAGVQTIKDFEDGVDFIGLQLNGYFFDNVLIGSSMRFADLEFTLSGEDTVISYEDRTIAVVENTMPSELSRIDFVENVEIAQIEYRYGVDFEFF